MTIRDLQIFLAVTTSGTMCKAAEQLHITQPSVSLAISAMESEFGVHLFERTSRQLRLTRTGQGLIRYAKNMLAMQQVTYDYLTNEAVSSRIRIGATATVGSCLITLIITKLLHQYPKLQHAVSIANTHIIEEKILANDLDIALVEGHVHSSELIVQKAIPDEMVLICSNMHPFSGRTSITLAELTDQPFILREEGSGTRAQIEEQFRLAGLECSIIWDCYQFGAIKDAVSHGLGVSILSERLVRQDVEAGALWACHIEGAGLLRTFNLVYHKNKHFTKQMQSFSDICLQIGQE